ncbi:MAG: U32 family peptidase [Oscillospiraceae bacterium]|nr:U32 family peptidase [Oscillospiraceae bacterium]
MKPELLAPSGNFNTLKAAVAAGADAVYFGAGKFSARAFAGNFDADELKTAIKYASDNNVKTYLAINTLMTDRELKEAMEIVKYAYNSGVSAFIVQDLGLASLISQNFPNANLHASTQMTASTLEDVEVLGKLGFKRVVLARELSRAQIKEISEKTNVELEVFVHGALCSAYSGQCLMSSFIGGRSANRGKCAQPCRLPYKSGGKSGVLLSLKDLCLVDYVGELGDLGISSLKIEGRMKGEDYVRTVVTAYRAVLDGKPLSEPQKQKMLGIFNRGGYTDGYFCGNLSGMYMDALKNPYGGRRKNAD